MKLTPAVLALTVAVLSGCSHSLQHRSERLTLSENTFIATNQIAVDRLIRHLDARLPAGSGPLLVTTLVNIDDLDTSSTLGRVISEQVTSRFVQHDYRIVEMKFGKSVYMHRDQGEMVLTRAVQETASQHAAKAVVVGTYGESRNHAFISLKVVQPETSAIIAVHDYAVPLSHGISLMLRNRPTATP
ncbi:FlgO family outer membrane protein [Pseudomonas sp. NW5]|uniref:FlgO family outer membrane protein n=1 Tax=Pseudomonas sp. NW5 TaxID=2934934 RepID=UPI0020204C6B|nr:FlgO family outer membrane protein [Pseudomonas sp. NW5]MCL7461397.1 FlgO family outer membrane protein [Pseudomonas sp. NW5]